MTSTIGEVGIFIGIEAKQGRPVLPPAGLPKKELNLTDERVPQADLDGSLVEFFKSNLPLTKRLVAQIEGWILGI